MRKFQVGDKVEYIGNNGIISKLFFDCIRHQGLNLGNLGIRHDKIYTIESIYSYDEKNDYINLVEIPGISFHKSRFKLEKSQIREDKLKELLK